MSVFNNKKLTMDDTDLLTKQQLKKLLFLKKTMPLQLIRRLSFRNRRSPDREMPLRKSSSCKGLPKMDRTAEGGSILPDALLLRILDQCEPMEQLKLRTVCRSFKNHVDQKLSRVEHLDVRKCDLKEVHGRGWRKNGASQVAMRLLGNTAEIVVDSKWTAKDIQTVVGMVSIFRKNITTATIDAPIAELLVVSISALDLNRWYAFQCYMKAMNVFDDADMHLECAFSNPGEVYWPKVHTLTIRTTEAQAPHLARVIDYGVQCNWVLDRKHLDLLKILFTDIDCTSKTVNRHLYHFRCWAGSAGFDHRYEQHFASKRVLI